MSGRAGGRRMTRTPAEREQLRLERYARYNRSRKGAARRQRYEDKHPERAERWSPLMLAKARDKR